MPKRDAKNSSAWAHNGGKREGAGRPPGKPNAPAMHFRDLCRRYDDEAIELLWDMATQKNWRASSRDPWLALAAIRERRKLGTAIAATGHALFVGCNDQKRPFLRHVKKNPQASAVDSEHVAN